MRIKSAAWAIITLFAFNSYFKCTDSYKIESSATIVINVDKAICTTTGCNETAADLLKKMDFNVDPCINFYEFSCGNFVKNTEIPEDQSYIDAMVYINEELIAQIKEVISEPIQPDDIQPFVLTKQLYKECMNEKMIEQRGLTPVTNIFNKLGGWPVLENQKWNEKEFIWHKTLTEMEQYGLDNQVIIDIGFADDAKNNTNLVLTISEAALSLDREYLIQGLENEAVQAYFEYMTNVAVAMGANEVDAKKELKESLLFEIKLAKLKLSNKERENATALYNPSTIKLFQETYPTIPLLSYVNSMLRSVKHMTEDDILINTVPKYTKEVEKLLLETPKRTIANYIFWRNIRDIIKHLPKRFTKIAHDYYSKTSGVTALPVRADHCYEVVKEHMNLAIAALYARKCFPKDSKTQASDIVNNIQSEYKNMFQTIDWMDQKTKHFALEKMNALVSYVAYPEELMVDDNVIEYYKNLNISENMYMESLLKITNFVYAKAKQEVRHRLPSSHWTKHSNTAEVNAFYSPENSIEFPAGILQREFFTNVRPKYMNYAGIGYVAGHEITHGFDNSGRKYDKNGNLVDWWEPATSEAFLNKAQCFIHQYGNYSVGNITLDGELTLGENIADNAGAKYAYRAYTRWAATHGPEPGLPGLPYTPRQMFWIGLASAWCSKHRPEYLKDTLLTDEHSLGHARINGIVSNQDEFAADFRCPKGSPMNPEVKCKVW